VIYAKSDGIMTSDFLLIHRLIYPDREIFGSLQGDIITTGSRGGGGGEE
jgi:hypothetical protein